MQQLKRKAGGHLPLNDPEGGFVSDMAEPSPSRELDVATEAEIETSRKLEASQTH